MTGMPSGRPPQPPTPPGSPAPAHGDGPTGPSAPTGRTEPRGCPFGFRHYNCDCKPLEATTPEPADRPPLRDQIAEALPCPVCPAQAGEPCVRARADNQQPHMSRRLRAEAVMPVIEAETAEVVSELRAVKIDRDEWRNRAHYWRATAGPPEGSEEYDLDTDPDALRRALAEVIDLMECRPARMIHDAVWARVRPVLRIHREKLAEERQRAETAERKLTEALDQIATERRGRLAAEAAARRGREIHRRHDCTRHVSARTPVPCANEGLCEGCGAPHPCRTYAALAIKQPKETP